MTGPIAGLGLALIFTVLIAGGLLLVIAAGVGACTTPRRIDRR